jgi:hypothetical protein
MADEETKDEQVEETTEETPESSVEEVKDEPYGVPEEDESFDPLEGLREETPTEEKPEDSDEEPAPTAEKEEETTEEKPSEDPYEGWDDLMRLAQVDYGLTEKQIRDNFATPDQLHAALEAHLDRQEAQMSEGAKDVGDKKEEQKEEESPVTLDPELYDKDLIEQFTRITDAHKEEVSGLKSELADMKASLNAIADSAMRAQQAETKKQLKGWIDDLGEDWSEHYGGGDIDKLKEGTTAHANLSKVVTRAALLIQTANQIGQPIDEETAFRDAHYLVNRASLEKSALEKARQEVKQKVEKHSRAVAPKPTARKGDPETGTAAAARAWDEAMSNKGYDKFFDQEPDDVNALLPD